VVLNGISVADVPLRNNSNIFWILVTKSWLYRRRKVRGGKLSQTSEGRPAIY